MDMMNPDQTKEYFDFRLKLSFPNELFLKQT